MQRGNQSLLFQLGEPVLSLPDGLQAALTRLDHLLSGALEKAFDAYGPQAEMDPFRGLHLEPEDMLRLLKRVPGQPVLYSDRSVGAPLLAGEGNSPFTWLQGQYSLSSFDLDILLLALAPEVDLRYERLYAYLQDDVARRRPGVDLALNLLCPTFEARLSGLARFAPGAPLLRYGLIHLAPPAHAPAGSMLAQQIQLDEQVLRRLLGLPGLDARLAGWCELTMPQASLSTSFLDGQDRETLENLARLVRAGEKTPLVYFYGPPGSGRRDAASALAQEAGKAFLRADLRFASPDPVGFAQAVMLLCREALFQDALLYLEKLEDLSQVQYQTLLLEAGNQPCPVVLAAAQPAPPDPSRPVELLFLAFQAPGQNLRRRLWQAALRDFFGSEFGSENEGPKALSEYQLDQLAERFQLNPGQIRSAVAMAHARLDGSDPGLVGQLFFAARAQTGHELAALASKLSPVYTWGDLVLPSDSLMQLHEISQRARCASQVLDAWGFSRRLSQGKGVNALFAGPPGTGKTMAAEVLANDLGLDLYRIDLAGVVSKYIGETEKNLERIFSAAESANAILFFDEADALFGKRSEVRDSHDRYANIEISYLLQKMEQYEGIAILATNLRQNLDESFVRRLAFSVHFPFPDAASRLEIWNGIWPQQTPLSAEVDLAFLAERFKLSGGNIKNIALAAAFAAAAENCPVGMRHLLHATRREYQKLGKAVTAEELGLYAG